LGDCRTISIVPAVQPSLELVLERQGHRLVVTLKGWHPIDLAIDDA
jgi:hypothetical protein